MADNIIPGMEDYFKEEEEEFFWDGVKKESYFDAANLADTPNYQANAEGAETFILYVVFPSREELVRAILALTAKGRKGLAAGAKIGTLNGAAVRDGMTLLEMWEKKILGMKPVKKKEPEADPDEAQAPV